MYCIHKTIGRSMMRSINIAMLPLIVSLFFGGCAHGAESVAIPKMDLGVIPIGTRAPSLKLFVSTDCGDVTPKFIDCSAKDAWGISYVFFDGSLSKVSAKRLVVSKGVRLPAGAVFGESIEEAANKVANSFGIKLEIGRSGDGLTVYSSHFVLKSSKGILFSIELIADEQENLSEVVERTDF